MMALRVLPDGSVVIHRRDATVHVDLPGQALHIRTGTSRDPVGGILLASYPLGSAESVQVTVEEDDDWRAQVRFQTGDAVALGRWMSRANAEATASAVAELISVPLFLQRVQTSDLPIVTAAPSLEEPGPLAVVEPDEIEVIPPDPKLAVDFVDVSSVVDVRAATSVLSLTWRSQLDSTRYFVPARGRFEQASEWKGIRTATGAFVRAISSAVSIASDTSWPPLIASPPHRYFVTAPGRLAAGLPARRADPILRVPPVEPILEPETMSTGPEEPPAVPPSYADLESVSWSEMVGDAQPLALPPMPLGALDELDHSSRERDNPVERLRAVVGPWREETPPPRFPPDTEQPSSVEMEVFRRPEVVPPDVLDPMYLHPLEAEPLEPELAEAEWALSCYRELAAEALPPELEDLPPHPSAMLPELPMVRSIDPNDESDDVAVDVRPKAYGPSRRRPRPERMAPTPPPAILEIPGFNDGSENEEEPSGGVGASPRAYAETPDLLNPEGGGEAPLLRLLLEDQPEDPDAEEAEVVSLEDPNSPLPRPAPGALLEMVRLASETLPSANVDLATAARPGLPSLER